MNQRGFTPIYLALGIFLIIGLIGGAYYLGRQESSVNSVKNEQQDNDKLDNTEQNLNKTQPFKSPISNLQTYTDKKYKFSFQYPNDHYINDFTECTNGAYAVSVGTKEKNPLCDAELTILVSESDGKTCYPDSSKALSKKDLVIDGLTGKQIVLENPRGTNKNETLIGILHNNLCFNITNRENLTPQETVDGILSSFRFTN